MALVAGEAGRFADRDARRISGDNLTPHHMPQTALGFTSRADGGALVMPYPEHARTRTFGRRGAITARQEAGSSFRQVLARDIRDVRSIVGAKYNHGLRDLITPYKTSHPNLMLKQVG